MIYASCNSIYLKIKHDVVYEVSYIRFNLKYLALYYCVLKFLLFNALVKEISSRHLQDHGCHSDLAEEMFESPKFYFCKPCDKFCILHIA